MLQVVLCIDIRQKNGIMKIGEIKSKIDLSLLRNLNYA